MHSIWKYAQLGMWLFLVLGNIRITFPFAFVNEEVITALPYTNFEYFCRQVQLRDVSFPPYNTSSISLGFLSSLSAALFTSTQLACSTTQIKTNI